MAYDRPKLEQKSQLQFFQSTGHFQTCPWLPIALVMLP